MPAPDLVDLGCPILLTWTCIALLFTEHTVTQSANVNVDPRQAVKEMGIFFVAGSGVHLSLTLLGN